MKFTFDITTFGCQMNAHDSDWLARSLTRMGFSAAEPGEALVYILNTCSVRERPENKVYSAIGRLRPFLEEKPEAFVAVGGCVAQQLGEGLFKRFPEVRLVFGTDGIKAAPQAIAGPARFFRMRVPPAQGVNNEQSRIYECRRRWRRAVQG